MKLTVFLSLIIQGVLCRHRLHCPEPEIGNIGRKYLVHIHSKFEDLEGIHRANRICREDVHLSLGEFSKIVEFAKHRHNDNDNVCLNLLVHHADHIRRSFGNILNEKCYSKVREEVDSISHLIENSVRAVERCLRKPRASCHEIRRCCDDVWEEFGSEESDADDSDESDESDERKEDDGNFVKEYEKCVLKECRVIQNSIKNVTLEVETCFQLTNLQEETSERTTETHP
ncbi:hypothetical protein RI129_007836 [Pyrocoelia pectoralis]|uniref:Uncharacterized protein n=1 Tax=Pyrocoelia pectoralis TaxID=417401 RepID=A0AAN7VEB5_9COLE